MLLSINSTKHLKTILKCLEKWHGIDPASNCRVVDPMKQQWIQSHFHIPGYTFSPAEIQTTTEVVTRVPVASDMYTSIFVVMGCCLLLWSVAKCYQRVKNPPTQRSSNYFEETEL